MPPPPPLQSFTTAPGCLWRGVLPRGGHCPPAEQPPKPEACSCSPPLLPPPHLSPPLLPPPGAVKHPSSLVNLLRVASGLPIQGLAAALNRSPAHLHLFLTFPLRRMSAWSNQGRAGGLVPLPGISPARLSAQRDRRVRRVKVPYTPTKSDCNPTELPDSCSPISLTQPTSQGACSTLRTSKFTMSRETCVQKIQAHAVPERPLVSQAVKGGGASVQLHFSSGFYSLAIQPAFTTLSKHFSLLVDGVLVSLPNAPIINKDQAGLLVDFQLQFLVNTPAGPQRTARLFLYPTTTSLQVQGGAKFTRDAGSPTVAEWFVANFVLPQIEMEIGRKKVSSDQVAAMNQAILNMRAVPISQTTSLSSLPPSSLRGGANSQPITAKLDGRTGRLKGLPHCHQCNQFLHSQCQSEHQCSVTRSSGQDSAEESDTEDLSNESLTSSSPVPASPAHQDYPSANEESPSVLQNLAPHFNSLSAAPPCFQTPLSTFSIPPPSLPTTNTSTLSSSAPLLSVSSSSPLFSRAPQISASNSSALRPKNPSQATKNQNTRGRSGLALTAGALDLEVSQRALFLCKEELALKESQLRQANTKSSVLADRVKLLEAEVTKLLSSQHLQATDP